MTTASPSIAGASTLATASPASVRTDMVPDCSSHTCVGLSPSSHKCSPAASRSGWVGVLGELCERIGWVV
eukprot:201360-Chlamydomonas_euryale.AAC.1